MDDDLMLALRLQEEWNLQEAERDHAQESLSLVDASWELVDPTPDLQALFVQFNDQFFWGQLEAVEVKWSVRMTLCAGICSYEGKGGMCSIRLSEPLLKLRPRKDLVEVYHTFHDEVDEYRRHWWRCNGPCQHRPPYYGYVKRATNREPSAHDYWWAEHQKTCGGTYIKIKEPENYSKKGKGKAKLGKEPVLAAENKDKPNRGEAQLVIPFSGKGYVLGETSNLPSPGKLITSHAINKTQDLLNQNHSANAVRPNSKIKVKFEQNGSSKNSHLVSPAVSNSHQNVLSNYFPRVSFANQKAFRGVNGSPRISVTVGNIPKNSVSSSSQRRVSSSKISLRNSSKVTESASVMPSQDVSGSEDTFPNKRPRLEDKTVFDNFFIKKEQIKSSGNDPKYSTTTAQNSSSSSSQSKMVNCPVCQNEVLESQINEHLDWCLEGDSIKVKSEESL
ncbi:DNA-dependent metalloprotease SPRTN isoform X1 [Homo sapiens]|uniref:DNA-dependent metalloprotease SPRTN isoform X1 n=1 Tax=Homo sapiens TaxID=9606 RepID=UPI0003EAEEEC|nr:DNA-dependent metalloprotease SPRTN isoform X1 [Homo sapiens]XP_054194986.1 DNA-dependent metalloprotease SPRTN isoform X1 [Homo sapiens]|eukprot:XP_006711881.1 sprT-like domain-containing protein Spartan isoform X1 [Homo sapiens]